MSERFDLILFDLGGVLVELGGVPHMRAWSRLEFTEEELWQRWLCSSAVRAFEIGDISPNAFTTAVIDEFELSVEPAVFLDTFDRFVKEPYAGATDLLATLKKRFTVVSLSNTNAVHWVRMGGTGGIGTHFHHNYPSHETGNIKPDAVAFTQIVDTHGVSPERILFLDDNQINVDAASACGLHAVRAAGFNAAVQHLITLGALDKEDAPSTVSA